MRAIWEIMVCLCVLVLLPFVPDANDRIVAYNRYQATLSYTVLRRQRLDPRSLHSRLRRAAKRQELLNEIARPAWEELQRRKWERGYNFGRILRIAGVCLAVGYGGDGVERQLKAHCPAGYAIWMQGCRLAMQGNNEFWKAITPPPPR